MLGRVIKKKQMLEDDFQDELPGLSQASGAGSLPRGSISALIRTWKWVIKCSPAASAACVWDRRCSGVVVVSPVPWLFLTS